MCSCRYLLHMPGQAYSSRLKNLLLCKSTVIFPDDGNHEFWYHLLEVTVSASQQSACEVKYLTLATEVQR